MRKVFTHEVNNFLSTLPFKLFQEKLQHANRLILPGGAIILTDDVFHEGLRLTDVVTYEQASEEERFIYSLLYVFAYHNIKEELLMHSFATADDRLSLNDYRYALKKSYAYHMDEVYKIF